MEYDQAVENALREIFEAIRLYGKPYSQRLLGDVVEGDNNAKNWSWLSAFIDCDSNEARRRCIEDEIRRNPNNLVAHKALALFNPPGPAE
jgi:hypothetical protein